MNITRCIRTYIDGKINLTLITRVRNLVPITYLGEVKYIDSATGVVGRHPCYSLTFNIGASSHLVPRPGPVSDTCSVP